MARKEKYPNTFGPRCRSLIDGIENLELFLDDEDMYNLHDSEITSLHWDKDNCTLDVSVQVIGSSYYVEGYDSFLDLHFDHVISLHVIYDNCGYIDDFSIKRERSWLTVIFGCEEVEVTCSHLTIDPPRFVAKTLK